MDRHTYILGCLLGTAVADAVGLRREGLSRQRAARMYGGAPLKPDLLFGRGFCSDDTEHTLMVGRALAMSAGDPAIFQQQLAEQLKKWVLTAPAGVGLATLRACLKLVIGFGPHRSGVYSAGNGAAMRSALLGVWTKSDEDLAKLVNACTRLTHTDARAEEGSLLVARAARLAVTGNATDPATLLADMAPSIRGEELRNSVTAAVAALSDGKSCIEFAESQGWRHGVSGYVNQTVPAALYCWAYSPMDFRQCVENAVLLGGDTDSVAAITGAICGANLGSGSIPQEWLDRLAEWPRTTQWIETLAVTLANTTPYGPATSPPSMHWLATVPRNLVFAAIVLALGFRRLLPLY